MNIDEREVFFAELADDLENEAITWGQAVRALRTEVAALNQAKFATMTKISVRTLRNLETDTGNPTVATLEAVLKPFGFRLTIGRRP